MAKRETKPKPLFACGLQPVQKDGNFLGNIIVHLQLKIFSMLWGSHQTRHWEQVEFSEFDPNCNASVLQIVYYTLKCFPKCNAWVHEQGHE